METVTINDVNPDSTGNDIDRRRLSDRLRTTDIAINHYRLAPGTGFPGGLHAHMDQEEVFVVIEGKATFETLASQSGAGDEITVGAGEAIGFAPGGEFHSGTNECDSDLVAFVVGAPYNSEDIRVPLECPECSHEDMRIGMDEDGTTFVCPDCNTERIPQACPDCGRDEMRFALSKEAQTIVCPDCDAEFERPPFRDTG